MKIKYLLFIALLISCSERSEFSYDHAKKSEIDLFFEDREIFEFYHDIDNSKIEGYFVTDNLEDYSSKIENLANTYNWDKIVDDKNRKMYIKKGESAYSVCIIHFVGKEVHLSIFSF